MNDRKHIKHQTYDQGIHYDLISVQIAKRHYASVLHCRVGQCLWSAPDDLVDPNTGCSIADLCPCDGPWKNHGAFVKCVAHRVKEFVANGLLTKRQARAIVAAAAHSICGKTEKEDKDGKDSKRGKNHTKHDKDKGKDKDHN